MPLAFLAPVAPDKFVYLLGITLNAAAMKLPADNPETRKVLIDNEDGTLSEYCFTDRPLNRGLLAATDEMKALGLPRDERMACGMRILHFSWMPWTRP